MAHVDVQASIHPEAFAVVKRLEAAARCIHESLELEVEDDLRAPAPLVRAGGIDLLSDGPAPPDWLLDVALLREIGPGHVLFLCVANSARSQIAEGVARSLAPADVRVSSAGSEPTRIHPGAVAALEEIGVDAGAQLSKGLDDVERPVDAVITLCAEEVCPVWLDDAWRVRWPLPDPAAPDAGPEAFREVRDELSRRLELLFRGP